MNETKFVKLKQLCKKIITGGTPLTSISEYYENGSIPWLKTKEVNFNRIHKTEYHITKTGLSNSSAKLIPRNSVIVAMYGQGDTAGRVAINKIPLATNQACCNLVLNEQLADYQFIYYYLMNSYEELVNRKTGSAQPNLNTNLIGDFEILVPPLCEQKAMSSILNSLDDKIDLLHRQNKTLEKIIGTLLKKYFFEGGSNKSFCLVKELVEFNPKRQLTKGSIAPYLEMANLSTTVFNPNLWYEREFQSGTKFINGDTLLARITPCLENGKAAYVTFLIEGQVGWGSTEFIVMRAKQGLHPFFSYILSRNNDFRDYAESCMEGSSGRQRVNVEHLSNYEIYLPSNDDIKIFNKTTVSIVPKLIRNSQQILLLTRLRDLLLPKLISGEIRIKHEI
jgi:type I restriction enzyme S subunit